MWQDGAERGIIALRVVLSVCVSVCELKQRGMCVCV